MLYAFSIRLNKGDVSLLFQHLNPLSANVLAVKCPCVVVTLLLLTAPLASRVKLGFLPSKSPQTRCGNAL